MSSLDDLAVYFFVRGDLREEDQMVQVSHAIMEMCLTYDPTFAKYRIVGLDGGQSEQAFNKTRRKMNDRGVPHVQYADPDFPQWGVTAIVTIPLTQEQALPLKNYRLRRYSPPVVASIAVALDGQRGASSDSQILGSGGIAGDSGINQCLRSSRAEEHSVSNGEVAGSTPAASSSLNCLQQGDL